MKLKIRCLSAVVLSAIPAIPILASIFSTVPKLPAQMSMLFAYVGLAFLGERAVYVYPCYAILVAVLACGMHSFSDREFSTRQERLWLGLPTAAGIFGLLTLPALIFGIGVLFLPLTVGAAIALFGWLIFNMKLLLHN